LENYKERLESGELKTLINEVPVFNIKEKWEVLFARIDIV
jgi:hypothetical protein